MLTEIRLLGRFAVCRGSGEVDLRSFGGGQARRLLRLLAIRRGQLVPRDVLAEAIWGDHQPADAAAGLNVLVHRARQALGEPALIFTGSGGYWLDPSDRCRVDAEMFLGAVEVGLDRLAAGRVTSALEALSSALALWTGEPLVEDTYCDWAAPYRLMLGRVHVEALEAAARAALELGQFDHVALWAAKALESEPLRETPYLLLARALNASGDRGGAIEVLDRLHRRLEAESLGLSAGAVRLRDHIRSEERTKEADSLSDRQPPDPAVPGRLEEARARLRDVMLRHGSGPERALPLATLAHLSGDAPAAAHLSELALVEADGDVPARAYCLAAAAIVKARLGLLEEANAAWAEVETTLRSLGAAGLIDHVRSRPAAEALDMLEHLAELAETWTRGEGIPPRSDDDPDRALAEGDRQAVEAILPLVANVSDGPPTDLESTLARALYETRRVRAEVALAVGASGADHLVTDALAVAPFTAERLGWPPLGALA